MPEQVANWDYRWGQVVGQAWADEAFKRRLFADPAAALKEHGLEMPAGVRVRVLENTDPLPEKIDGIVHLVLPGKPPAEDLSEEELQGGVGSRAAAYCGCEHCSCHRCHHCERCACGRCD